MSQKRGISRVVNVPPVAPGFVGPGHHQHPRLVGLTNVDDWDDVASISEVSKEKFPVGSSLLGNQLHNGGTAIVTRRSKHSAKPALAELIT